MRPSLIAICVSLSFTTSARAQGFNIDVGLNNPPAADHGAVTGQLGHWNLVSAAAASTTLKDLAGIPTTVTVTCSPPGTDLSFGGGGCCSWALLQDEQDLGTGPSPLYTWTVSGLANGDYRVTLYSAAMSDIYFGTTELTLIGGARGTQTCTELFPNYDRYHYGASFVQDTTTVTNGTLTWTLRASVGDGEFNGVQIEPVVPAEMRTYCWADPNSQGCVPRIYATGSASLAANTLRVKAANVLNNEVGILFWGRAPNGDLHRCVAGLVRRTPVQLSGGNPPPDDCSGEYSFHWNAAYSAMVGVAPGDTVWCQYYARDPNAFSGASFTNGLAITFAPYGENRAVRDHARDAAMLVDRHLREIDVVIIDSKRIVLVSHSVPPHTTQKPGVR